jgi:hypothetical protein
MQIITHPRVFGPAGSRFDSKRGVFQPEPVSRPEARCTIPAIFKVLKTRRLRQAAFGIRPAFNWAGCGQKTKKWAKPSDGRQILV